MYLVSTHFDLFFLYCDSEEEVNKGRRNGSRNCEINYRPVPRFTLIIVNEFRRFLSQLSTNFHEILQAISSSGD